MRIRILSDLHREFGPTDIPKLDADLIVLAGDIATKQNGLPWIREFAGQTPAALVCGNHEFYGDKLPRVTERLVELTAGSNIHVLEDSSFSVGTWRIHGCTLWTDMALQGPWQTGAALAAELMNDYRRIRNSSRGYKRLTPADTRQIHLTSRLCIERFLASENPERTIIVTHHAPSARSLPLHRRSQEISCAYASHMDDLILRHQPALWIHGHIHHPSDYQIGSTRVIANPQAYPDEPGESFNPELIIEVPD